jgi:hypothetical protein
MVMLASTRTTMATSVESKSYPTYGSREEKSERDSFLEDISAGLVAEHGEGRKCALYPADKAFSPTRFRKWRDRKAIEWNCELLYITVRLYLYTQLSIAVIHRYW